jgi:hypothetical protein
MQEPYADAERILRQFEYAGATREPANAARFTILLYPHPCTRKRTLK